MKLTLLAVGTRLPSWAESACAEYARRFPPDLPLAIVEVKAEPRTGGKPVVELKRREAERLRAQIPTCLLYTSPSPREATLSRMPSSA